MSRGYDGPEIDDSRDPGWERKPDRPSRDWSRETATDWRAQANVRLKLQKLREAESRSDHLLSGSREHAQSSRSDLSRHARQPMLLGERDRESYVDRDRTYSLRPSEIHTLTDVGKFRVVGVEDLAKFNYAGDRARLESDLRNLKEQGLVVQRGTSALKKESRQVLTLTKQGQHLIRRHGFLPEDQAIYSGFVKPKEADHDADLYRMYRKAGEEIERKGGKVLQVQLDYELKEKLYQRLGRSQARNQGEAQKLKESFARDLELPVVHGKVSLPDLRIEYATQDMEITRVDLELATRHYHAGHLAEKASAGFQLYASILSNISAPSWQFWILFSLISTTAISKPKPRRLIIFAPRSASAGRFCLPSATPEPSARKLTAAISSTSFLSSSFPNLLSLLWSHSVLSIPAC